MLDSSFYFSCWQMARFFPKPFSFFSVMPPQTAEAEKHAHSGFARPFLGAPEAPQRNRLPSHMRSSARGARFRLPPCPRSGRRSSDVTAVQDDCAHSHSDNQGRHTGALRGVGFPAGRPGLSGACRAGGCTASLDSPHAGSLMNVGVQPGRAGSEAGWTQTVRLGPGERNTGPLLRVTPT